MKKYVEYKLDSDLRENIVILRNIIKQYHNDAEIYLFGSISKGGYSKTSDIDILVLLKEDKSLKEIRQLRHLIEDKIEELKLSRDVDVKMYCRNRYRELSAEPSFERAILKDLIDLRSW